MNSTKAVMALGEALWILAAIGFVVGSVLWAGFAIHWIAGVVVAALWNGLFWLVHKAIGDPDEWDDEWDMEATDV